VGCRSVMKRRQRAFPMEAVAGRKA
jgi:hypothetical protein